MANGPIGIFDSGYGGLTVMKDIINHPSLNKYDYIYFGDNARTPYGNRSKETIIEFAEEAVNFLFNSGVQLIIFACFTASSLALRELQEKYLRNPKSKFKDRKILGVIKPIVEKAVKETRAGRIGVTGTRATINSKAFEIEFKNLSPPIKVVSQACPLLVPLIEEHWHKKPEARMILKKYLSPLKSQNIDTLILGCTHYPILINEFKKIIGKRTRVLDSGRIIAESLTDYLDRHPEIKSKLSSRESRHFFTTDNPDRFREFSKNFLGMQTEPEKINLQQIPAIS